MAVLFWAALPLNAFEASLPAVTVDPAFCDRVFPYVRFQGVWQDTPAARSDVMVPNVILVYGQESREVVAAAARIAFYLGNWTEDIGFDGRDFQNARMPEILVSEKRMPQTTSTAIIVIGKNNQWVRKFSVKFEGPSVIGREHGGKDLLYVGGRTEGETLSAIRYLADHRLNFKSGAYKTYFNFIRVRGYLEEENWAAARTAIHSPGGLSACGRNMAVAGPSLANAPQVIREHIRHRNALLYKELPKAVEEADREKARSAWTEAMTTCYGCHQGMGQIPRLRKYRPPEAVHSKHHRIAREFPSLSRCSACHEGPTEIRGYEDSY
jgi:hypothetical protein